MNFSYSDICAHLCTNNSRLKGIQLQHLNHTIFCSLILQIHLELGIWIWSCPTRALSYHLNQHLFTPQFPFPSPSIPLSCPPVGSPVSCVCFCLCWARLATTWLSVAALGAVMCHGTHSDVAETCCRDFHSETNCFCKPHPHVHMIILFCCLSIIFLPSSPCMSVFLSQFSFLTPQSSTLILWEIKACTGNYFVLHSLPIMLYTPVLTTPSDITGWGSSLILLSSF